MGENESLELCDRLSRSLTRARLMPYDVKIEQRLDHLDEALENCRDLLAALEDCKTDTARNFGTPVDGHAADNVIPFPGPARHRDD
ncbi:MAG: hypothetical protein JJ899_03600 [Alphaproteobacteria bacterium]|nr:hypothetical protein [Alphaproteobacteria bacterium]